MSDINCNIPSTWRWAPGDRNKDDRTLTWVSNHLRPVHGLDERSWYDVIKIENVSSNYMISDYFVFCCITQLPVSKACICSAPCPNLEHVTPGGGGGPIRSCLQWGGADTEIKVPSCENTERKHSPFKAWSRSVYSHTCYALTARDFFSCLFLPFRSIHMHFFPNRSWFLLC